MERNIYGYNPEMEQSKRTASFPALMTKVYLWMTLALAMTGLTAFCIANNESIFFAIATNRVLLWGLLIAELVLVMILSGCIMRLSFPAAGALFAAYAILNGATLSFILLVYTMESIAATFFVTAGTFGAMTLFGMFTKRDLGAWGRFLFMALIGLIIATLVNMFMASSTLACVLNYAGVLIFCGLTAYDTQKMKVILMQCQNSGDESVMKIALLCSLSLYLDFINLFLYLLRFFGRRD